jgi:hypothetical protein
MHVLINCTFTMMQQNIKIYVVVVVVVAVVVAGGGGGGW